MALGSVVGAGVARGEERVTVRQNRDLKRTIRQTKRARREIRRYTSGVVVRGAPTEAFATDVQARCYAVAILLDRGLPEVRAEAGALIACLLRDREQGILDYVRRETAKARSIRRRAMGPLVRRWDYPEPGWLDRINEDILSRDEAIDDHMRGTMSREPELFRMVVVDPAFKDCEEKA